MLKLRTKPKRCAWHTLQGYKAAPEATPANHLDETATAKNLNVACP
ncbi:MAG: hypothetical protein JW993_04315 [Sedimentisphaerales bacterium]|nr:hypothetical protein [Sedimentisphaerales bacterium]